MIALLNLLVFPLLVGVHLAQANHTTCSWRIGVWKQTPLYNGFTLWCTGALRQIEDGHGDYTCLENSCLKVADWGVLGKDILEWGKLSLLRLPEPLLTSAVPHLEGTPCGGGGYGYSGLGNCIARFWALCIGDSNDGNCYYMDSADDCERP